MIGGERERITCSFLRGVLCAAAGGKCSVAFGWLSSGGGAVSVGAALASGLDSNSEPGSVVMVIQTTKKQEQHNKNVGKMDTIWVFCELSFKLDSEL